MTTRSRVDGAGSDADGMIVSPGSPQELDDETSRERALVAPTGMWARRLWLADFRSHHSAEIEFASGLTVVVGPNGRGKTNLLEALGYAATSTSFRDAPNEALVRRGAEMAIVRLEGSRQGREFLIEAEIRATGRGRMQLNRHRVGRSRDLAEALLVSVFTPDDLELVKGGPSLRRSYLDSTLIARHPRHDALCRDVDRILRQKSALLKQARGTLSGDIRTTLEVWNHQLIESGEQLLAARLDLLTALTPQVAEAYRQIAGAPLAADTVTLTYRSTWTAEGLSAALERLQADEVRRGVCLVGPQRDDVHLEIDGLPSRTHASQGEQRTLALAMRLGAHRVIGEAAGVFPVLLLDDIFSELDQDRSQALLANLPPGQAILTTADEIPCGVTVDALLRLADGRVDTRD